MRAAIYARYSSDLQRDASIEDQVRQSRARIEREGWMLASVYSDHATSGTSSLRPGYQKLLDDARAGAFDVVVAEALDRLSRDLEATASLYKQLSFAGVRLTTLAEGEITDLHVGLKGTMNQLYLKDLAQKTRRGLEGRVRQGRSGGGRCYGYDVVRQVAANGEPETGLRVINEAEAAVIRRVFAEFAAGKGPRAIARDLNAEAIRGPDGRPWGDTTIRGHAKRGTGLINNELYVGRLVWNRQRYVNDPRTGRRVARLNTESERIIQQVPDLRIVDKHLWSQVKARQTEIQRRIGGVSGGSRGNSLNGAHRRQFLLSGLLVCGSCGGGYTIRGRDRYACANHANRGTCGNKRTINRQALENRVLGGLKDKLLAPDLLAVFIEEFVKAWNEGSRDADAAWAASRRELTDVDRRIAAMIEAIEQGVITPTTKERLLALERRKAELAALPVPQAVPRIHPGLADVYRRQVERLEDALNDPAVRPEATEVLRALIEKIVLTPGTKRGEVKAELYGELGALLALGDARTQSRTSLSEVRLSVVAGAGFEPATFRL